MASSQTQAAPNDKETGEDLPIPFAEAAAETPANGEPLKSEYNIDELPEETSKPTQKDHLKIDTVRANGTTNGLTDIESPEGEASGPRPVDNPEISQPSNGISYADAMRKGREGTNSGSSTSGFDKETGINGKRRKHKNRKKASTERGSGTSTTAVNGANDTSSKKEVRRRSKTSWAPMNVPFPRRLQMSAVLVHCTCLMFCIPIFLFCCANVFLWPLLVPYMLHIIFSTAATDGSLRYRSEKFRSLPIWKYFANYFPAQLHKTHDLPATRKYIFGYHPHGIISHGAWVAFGTNALGFADKFPGITNSLLTLESNFKLPIYREYVLMAGVRSVSGASIKNILSKGGSNGEGMGRAVTIVVGGARESLEARPGTLRLILRDRVGFIKMAIRTGADLVPVLAFGENDLYDQLNSRDHPWVHKVQKVCLKMFKFTLPAMHGRGVFNYDSGFMPYRRPLNIIVGKPIPVVATSNDLVDPAEVDRLHKLYCKELQSLWDTYKDQYAKDRKEEIEFLP